PVGAEGPEIRGRAGRPRGDGAGWRGAGAGRRPQLCGKPVQSRGRGKTPAGLDFQAVRVSDGARTRPYARVRKGRPANRTERLAARKLQSRILWTGHT